MWDTRTPNRGVAQPHASARLVQTPGAERRRKRRSAQRAKEKTDAAAQSPRCAMSFSESGDYISDAFVDRDTHLLTSSGDGHLQVFDVRKAGKWYAQSEGVDDDLLSVLVVDKKKARGGGDARKRVLVGSKETGVHIFEWGQFGVASDHFAYPEAADVLIDVEGDSRCNAVVIASSDGAVGLCTLWPHAEVRRIGRHAGGQPVESACLSGRVPVEGEDGRDTRWLLSAGHDKRIRCWDMTAVCDDGMEAGRWRRRRGGGGGRRGGEPGHSRGGCEGERCGTRPGEAIVHSIGRRNSRARRRRRLGPRQRKRPRKAVGSCCEARRGSIEDGGGFEGQDRSGEGGEGQAARSARLHRQ